MRKPHAQAEVSRRDFFRQSGVGAASVAAASLLASPLLAAPSHGTAAAAPDAPFRAPASRRPIGIELYAVRGELNRDLPATLRAVAAMGYEAVEFYSPYLAWTLPYAKTVRSLIDDLGVRCYSTHNSAVPFTSADVMTKAIELNQILGARQLIMASPPFQTGVADDWTRLAGQLTAAADTLRSHGLVAGYHNHDAEWARLPGGQRAMDILAAGTPADVVLQLDIGHCLRGGGDPVAWVQANPGRIRSVHLKDWAPGTESEERSFRVLFGEGVAPWKPLLAALESVGGVEFYLMEQEGSRLNELDTARRCLANWKALRRKA